MFDHSLGDNLAICEVFLLNTDDSSGDTWCRRSPVTDILDSHTMQSILVDLVPIKATFLDSHETNDWAKHDDQVNLVVPHHLPKVGKRVARTL